MKVSKYIMCFFLSLLFFVGCDKKRDVLISSTSSISVAPEATKPLIEDASASKNLELAQPTERKWWHDAVIYQIWPRSFHDANGDGNGDFFGMTQKIPYLKDLGINAVWLTPVFESSSYHGYDTTNFLAVEKDYGTEAEFEGFLQQTEAAGIKVIVDLVINHISDQHPWFIKSINKEAGFEDFFVWSKTMPLNYGKAWSDVPNPQQVWHYNETRKEFYYSVFGATQPDLNLTNPAVIAEVKKVAAYWLAKGVDGFRLDAVRYLIEEGGIPLQADTKSNREFLADFSAYVKSKNPNAYLIGEAFADNNTVASYYNDGKGLDASFDFDFALNVGRALEDKPLLASNTQIEKANQISLLREAFWSNLNQRNTKYAPGYFFAPFTSNHDTGRLMARMKNQIRASVAASLLLTSPGTPYIYYGEEIGMSQAGSLDDMYYRALMQWDDSNNAGFNSTGKRWLDEAGWFPWKEKFEPWWGGYWSSANNSHVNVISQSADKKSLLEFYKKLISLRNKDLVLRSPESIKLYEATGNAWVAKYTRANVSRWIILNLDTANVTTFQVPAVLRGAFLNLLNDELLTLGGEISVSAGELMVLSAE